MNMKRLTKTKNEKNTIMLQRKIDMKAKNTKRWTNKYHKVVNCKYCKSVNFLMFHILFVM